MTTNNEYHAADAARRKAMIDANTKVLAGYLSDDLTWTHSSGRTDDKQAVLATISEGSVRYLSLDTEDLNVRAIGTTVIATGIVMGRVSKDGAERDLKNRFLSVWRQESGSFRMMAWQSTGLA